MNDGPDNFVSALVYLLGELWKFVAIAAAVVIGYVFLSMALGEGVGALRDAIRRRRAAKRPEPESELDS
jgi:hypothetical protein